MRKKNTEEKQLRNVIVDKLILSQKCVKLFVENQLYFLFRLWNLINLIPKLNS